MNLTDLYAALAEPTRLRLVNLLAGGPLCVCHLQEILGEPQVKVSKHLATLKAAGLVEARREANWMIYALAAKRTAAFEASLTCLSADNDPTLAGDRKRLAKLLTGMPEGSPACTLGKPAGKGVLRDVKTGPAGKIIKAAR